MSPLARADRPRRPAPRPAAVALLGTLLGGLAGADASARQGAAAPVQAGTRVAFETSLGAFVVQLEDERAPYTVANFLAHVRSGHYEDTLFHRVVQNFVVQGGGHGRDFEQKPHAGTVPNESGNGLSNRRGAVGLARGESPHSGNVQFYVNLRDNPALDPTPLRWGYAVFGRVVEGMEVVDGIAHVATGRVGPWERDAPLEPVVLERVRILAPDEGTTATPGVPAAPARASEPPAR